MNTEKINPKFVAWFQRQDAATKAAIRAKWDQIDARNDLSPTSVYARQFYLMQHCATLGYDFT